MAIQIGVIRGHLLGTKEWLTKYQNQIKVYSPKPSILGPDSLITADMTSIMIGSGKWCPIQVIDKEIADTCVTISQAPKKLFIFGGGLQLVNHANIQLKRGEEVKFIPANGPPVSLQDGDELILTKNTTLRINFG